MADLPTNFMSGNVMEYLSHIVCHYVIRDEVNADCKSLIHKACMGQTTNNFLASTFRLLLRAGADPKDVDVDGNGPASLSGSKWAK